jgi:hypothetical protein
MFWTEFLTTCDPSAPWFMNKAKRVLRGTDGNYAVSMDIVHDHFYGDVPNAGKAKAKSKVWYFTKDGSRAYCKHCSNMAHFDLIPSCFLRRD